MLGYFRVLRHKIVLTTIWGSSRLKENKERHEWEAALMSSCVDTRVWGWRWSQCLLRHPTGHSETCSFVICVKVCVLLEKGWILSPYRRPLICMWVDPWPQPHTAVHTSTPAPSPLFTTLNACIPAACSHKGQRSSRQSCLSGHHQLWHSSIHLLIQRMSVLRACWWPWINAEQHKHPQWLRKLHSVNFL